jgi:hypothetical protein
MSAESMRQVARYAIEHRMKEVANELADRHGDSESQMRVAQGKFAGLGEALAIIDECYKGLGQ